VIDAQWKQALVFRIGDKGIPPAERLPKPWNFHRSLKEGLSQKGAGTLGYVLALGLLKLHRSAREELFDANDRVFPGFLCHTRPPASEMRGIVESIWNAVEWNLGCYLTLATQSPACQAQFHQMLDELDNEVLHQMAVYAVVGREVADLFDLERYSSCR
jgi:hypothetical protein